MREAGAILTAALASQGEDEEVHAAGKAARRTTVFDEPEVGAVYVTMSLSACLPVRLTLIVCFSTTQEVDSDASQKNDWGSSDTEDST